MARDTVTVLLPTTDVTKSVQVGEIVKTAVTQANGINIANAFKNKNNSLEIFVENTTTASNVAAASTLTIKKGDKYPNSMLGDLTVAIGAGKTVAIEYLDMSRFEKTDGSVDLDFASGFTGNVWAVAKRAGILPANLQ